MDDISEAYSAIAQKRPHVIIGCAYLTFPSTGYNPHVLAGWTSLLVNAGEGIDVDFYFLRQPKERIQAKLGQQIRINRSRIKDASDTNTDFDDIEGAIQSGYFLKQGLANYEDFYYVSIIVTITADTPEKRVLSG